MFRVIIVPKPELPEVILYKPIEDEYSYKISVDQHNTNNFLIFHWTVIEWAPRGPTTTHHPLPQKICNIK